MNETGIRFQLEIKQLSNERAKNLQRIELKIVNFLPQCMICAIKYESVFKTIPQILQFPVEKRILTVILLCAEVEQCKNMFE